METGKSFPLWAKGIEMAGTTYLLKLLAGAGGVSVDNLFYTAGIIGGAAVTLLGLVDFENKHEKAIKEIMGNEGIKILKEEKTSHGYNIWLKIPNNICLSNFLEKKEYFEQSFNAEVEFQHVDNKFRVVVKDGVVKDLYRFKETMEELQGKNKHGLLVGYSRTGMVFWDFKKYPHLLVGGGTGAGKSTFLMSLITIIHMLMKKHQVILNLIDFKGADLSVFEQSCFVRNYCRRKEEFKVLLKELEGESKRRYALFDSQKVRNIYKYNQRIKPGLPHVFTIIDEFSICEKDKEIHGAIQERLALDRAAGMHYIIATQSPRREVIPGLLKCNIPARLAFKTFNVTDSEVLFDQKGPEMLRGDGEALFKTNKIERVQCPLIEEEEAEELIKPFIIEKKKEPITKENLSGVIDIVNTKGRANYRTNRKI